MASVSTIKRTFCGVDFELKATTEAWAQVEEERGVFYGVILDRMRRKGPTLLDMSAIFAACVQPQGSATGKSIRSIMPFDDGSTFTALCDLVQEVIEAGMPQAKKTETTEAKGKPVNPQ